MTPGDYELIVAALQEALKNSKLEEHADIDGNRTHCRKIEE